MKKSLLLLLVTSTAAAAQPAPPPARPPAQTTRVAITIELGTDKRKYEMLIADDDCATIKQKAGGSEDEVKVCAFPATNGVVLKIEGKARNNAMEFEERAQAVVARKGSKLDIGRTGGTRFAVETL